jgi:hypothetical protein
VAGRLLRVAEQRGLIDDRYGEPEAGIGMALELHDRIECIAAMNDEALDDRALYALDGWSDHQ